MAQILLSVLLVLTGLQGEQAGPPKGTFVSSEDHCTCIEFSDDGRYFLSDGSFRYESGHVRKTGSSLICEGSQNDLQFEFQKGKLVSKNGLQWLPRESVVRTPGPNPSNVTIVVLDSKSKKPVKEFDYTCEFETDKAEYCALLARPIHVASADGSFSLLAPDSCEIRICVEGKVLVGGYGTIQTLKLTSLNKHRRLEVLVERGVSVSGVVVDAKSGYPVGGAVVSPMTFFPPLFGPLDSKSVKTDADGKFEINGVNASLGVYVAHDEYLDSSWSHSEPGAESSISDVQVKLSKSETIFGEVHDANGKPLSGVTVSDRHRKSTKSGVTGKFALRSPRTSGATNSGAYELRFGRDGYLQTDVTVLSGNLDQVRVSLEPLPLLKLNVSTTGSGELNTSILLATGPGCEPRSWACTEGKGVRQGPFALNVLTHLDFDNENVVWVGVKTEGYAFWETVVPEWKGNKTLEVQLLKGVSVTGKISNRSQHRGRIRAHLLPARLHSEDGTSETSQRQEMARTEVSVAKTGEFCFTDIASGTYILAIGGDEISPISNLIQVSGLDLDAGSFSVQGTGTVIGVVHQNPRFGRGKGMPEGQLGVQAFADGEIHFSDSAGNSNDMEFRHLSSIRFKTDEHGRFRVENVPAGVASVRLPYMATADIVGADILDANVVEGKTTDVAFFSPDRRNNVRCQIVVGDGTKENWLMGTGLNASRKAGNVNDRDPIFRIDVKPISGFPSAFAEGDWKRVNAKAEVTLSDVAPGRYELVVGDWLGSRGFKGELFRAEFEVVDKPIEVKIPLGAGCVTGTVDWQKD